jgi:hypothetical protein
METSQTNQSLVAQRMELYEQESTFPCSQKAQACVIHGVIVIRIKGCTDAAVLPSATARFRSEPNCPFMPVRLSQWI